MKDALAHVRSTRNGRSAVSAKAPRKQLACLPALPCCWDPSAMARNMRHFHPMPKAKYLRYRTTTRCLHDVVGADSTVCLASPAIAAPGCGTARGPARRLTSRRCRSGQNLMASAFLNAMSDDRALRFGCVRYQIWQWPRFPMLGEEGDPGGCVACRRRGRLIYKLNASRTLPWVSADG